MCTTESQKKIVTEADAVQSNIDSFGDDIGKTTNWITSMFDVQSQFEKEVRSIKSLIIESSAVNSSNRMLSIRQREL